MRIGDMNLGSEGQRHGTRYKIKGNRDKGQRVREVEGKRGQWSRDKRTVLASGSAHARPSAQPPIDTSGNFPAHVYAESPSNISPNP